LNSLSSLFCFVLLRVDVRSSVWGSTHVLWPCPSKSVHLYHCIACIHQEVPALLHAARFLNHRLERMLSKLGAWHSRGQTCEKSHKQRRPSSAEIRRTKCIHTRLECFSHISRSCLSAQCSPRKGEPFGYGRGKHRDYPQSSRPPSNLLPSCRPSSISI